MNCKSALRIGIDSYINSSGKSVIYNYKDIPIVEEWIDATKWLPYPFDLVSLKLNDKTKIGWYTGRRWDGRQVKPSDKVYAWKRKSEDE